MNIMTHRNISGILAYRSNRKAEATQK